MALDDLLKGLGALKEGLKSNAINTSLQEANAKLADINTQFNDQLMQGVSQRKAQEQMLQQKMGIAQQLAGSMIGFGANAADVNQATQFMAPNAGQALQNQQFQQRQDLDVAQFGEIKRANKFNENLKQMEFWNKFQAENGDQKLANLDVVHRQIKAIPSEWEQKEAVKERAAYMDWQKGANQFDPNSNARIALQEGLENIDITDPVALNTLYSKVFMAVKGAVGERMTDADAVALVEPFVPGKFRAFTSKEALVKRFDELHSLIKSKKPATPIGDGYKIDYDLRAYPGQAPDPETVKQANWLLENKNHPRYELVRDAVIRKHEAEQAAFGSEQRRKLKNKASAAAAEKEREASGKAAGQEALRNLEKETEMKNSWLGKLLGIGKGGFSGR